VNKYRCEACHDTTKTRDRRVRYVGTAKTILVCRKCYAELMELEAFDTRRPVGFKVSVCREWSGVPEEDLNSAKSDGGHKIGPMKSRVPDSPLRLIDPTRTPTPSRANKESSGILGAS
jgi:hypothetical protein